jgi:quercetin 2,3-dioxygenase
MSGPIRDTDLAAAEELVDPPSPLDTVEVREGRRTSVGGLEVARVLPTKGRRTVGPWCFVDLLGPMDLDDPDPLEVGPHPHIGLSTVTWLTAGEALHTDSLGTEQVIRAGQLNLMTAGHGISHAELAARPPFHGIQLWLAQPETTRHGPSAFAHHGELPEVALDGTDGHATAAVLLGSLEGTDGTGTSPARTDWPTLGAEVRLSIGTTVVAIDPTFEHAVAPIDAALRVGTAVVEPGWIALVPTGLDELPIASRTAGARALLLGGLPLGGPIAMWWNFVARDRDELTAAWRDWNARTERFGTVASPLDRLDAPAPPWVTGP